MFGIRLYVPAAPHSHSLELSGHAAKNQDLLVASGAIHLQGSDGLSAVDDDIQAVVCERVPETYTVLTSYLGLQFCRRSSPLSMQTPHMSLLRVIAN